MSDLEVTYLIFPGSADETKGPPDFAKWHQTCSTLLEEIGGISEGYTLHQWEDLITKKRAEKEVVAEVAPTAPPGDPAPGKPFDAPVVPAPDPESGTQEAGKQVPE